MTQIDSHMTEDANGMDLVALVDQIHAAFETRDDYFVKANQFMCNVLRHIQPDLTTPMQHVLAVADTYWNSGWRHEPYSVDRLDDARKLAWQQYDARDPASEQTNRSRWRSLICVLYPDLAKGGSTGELLDMLIEYVDDYLTDAALVVRAAVDTFQLNKETGADGLSQPI